ncbi:hypothetical protein ACF0H5_024503 [Mactra antiquata]
MATQRSRQISRARSFPARGDSRDVIQIDPRIINQQRVAFLRVRRRPQQTRPLPAAGNTRSPATVTTSDCRAPRSIRCFIWSRGRDTSGAFRCEGRCRGRSCVLPCECSCVHPRLIRPLLQMGRIRGPELRPLDNRLREPRRTDPNTNTPLAIRQALQRRLGGGSQRGAQTETTRSSTADRNQGLLPTINFGISEDVLATLIAQPVLNEIVGPQGINQILAGEPPQILSREAIRRGRNTRNRQDLINRQTTSNRRFTEENAGIPVPLSQLNLFPDSRGRSSDLMSSPTEMSLLPAPVNEATVQQLPGTNVLFVNLSRSGQSANRRTVAERLKLATPDQSTQTNDVINSTLGSRDLSLSSGLGATLNNLIQEPAIPSRFLPPTKAECLSLNLELWCDPQPPWDGTPGVSRWCLLNCRADNCDNQRCACSCIEEILFTAKYDQLTLQAP